MFFQGMRGDEVLNIQKLVLVFPADPEDYIYICIAECNIGLKLNYNGGLSYAWR